MNDFLEIIASGKLLCRCISAIVVPKVALAEPAYVRTLALQSTVQSKHEFFALSQISRIQFSEGELLHHVVTGHLEVKGAGGAIDLADGMIISRSVASYLAVFANTQSPLGKFFEAAERFCTRWIRLDI